MLLQQVAPSGNQLSTEHAQAAIGHNGRTRPEWLHTVLYGGDVTRVSQHLALLIYTLTDPTTNAVHLSLRDIERITGWSRQTVHDHLEELKICLRIEIARGRAKSRFELEGAITDAVAVLREQRETANQIDAAADTTAPTPSEMASQIDAKIDANLVSAKTAKQADATADTKTMASQIDATADTKSVAATEMASQIDTKPSLGGTIGGESRTPVESKSGFSCALAHAPPGEASPILWQETPEGGFEGQAFELWPEQYRDLKAAYAHLDFPADLVAADAYLASEFERVAERDISRRLGRLHTYLAARNRKQGLLVARVMNPDGNRRQNDDSCWFDGDRIVVANGFRAELLGVVGQSEKRLEITLGKAAGNIPENLRGPALRKAVRAAFLRQAEYDERDERKVRAIEQRGAPKPVSFKPRAPAKVVNYDPADDPELQEFARSLMNSEVPK